MLGVQWNSDFISVCNAALKVLVKEIINVFSKCYDNRQFYDQYHRSNFSAEMNNLFVDLFLIERGNAEEEIIL